MKLKLEANGTREITRADGSQRAVPYVGAIGTRFINRAAYVGAIVMGDEVILGAIPIEDMDLVIIPHERRVDINPANPDFAAARL